MTSLELKENIVILNIAQRLVRTGEMLPVGQLTPSFLEHIIERVYEKTYFDLSEVEDLTQACLKRLAKDPDRKKIISDAVLALSQFL